MDEKAARIAAYLRVSTDAQTGEDRFGLPAQRAAVEEYAQREGIEIHVWYSDEGISGASLDRPALISMIAAASAGEIQRVIVPKMDRLSRDLFGQLWIEKELGKHGVAITSATEPLNGDDFMMTAFRQMTGVFAELEKGMITARLHGGRLEKAKRGGYAGGGGALGYRRSLGSKRLEIIPEEAAVVRRIFALRAAMPTASLRQLATQAQKEGLKPKKGQTWSAMQISRVLKNEALYRGQIQYGGVTAKAQHEEILQKGFLLKRSVC